MHTCLQPHRVDSHFKVGLLYILYLRGGKTNVGGNDLTNDFNLQYCFSSLGVQEKDRSSQKGVFESTGSL